MRNMQRISITLLCMSLFVSCGEESVESRMKRVEKRAAEHYVQYQIQIRAQQDLRTLFSKSDAELKTLGLHHPVVVRNVYQARHNKPVWLGDHLISDAGANVTRLLDDAVLSHGIDPARLHQKKRAELLQRNDRPPYVFELTAKERKHIETMLASQPASEDEAFAKLLGGESSPLERIRESTTVKAHSTAGPSRLEMLTTDAAIEFGMAMRWSHDVWTKKVTWPEHLQGELDEKGEEDVTRQLKQKRRLHIASREMLRLAQDKETIAEKLSAMVPKYEQYRRLSKAFSNYRTMVANGGWKRLPQSAAKLSLGDVDPKVSSVKERLRAEGYWKGDDSHFFTEPLRESIKVYQKTHQLWEKGSISRETLLSMNVSAETRLSQIRVALERWRGSHIGTDDYYLFVNIPDFHLEVWRGGEREQRFKTVVGATAVTTDKESGERAHGFATPRLTSEVSSVIWDPYWWVPEGIESDELLPQLAEQPDLMEKMGYEWAQNHAGDVVMRQRPGPRNVLGRVKFTFDNPYSIYMHDTPEKQIFGWPVRAESHGCIRLERPIDLARVLLANDMKWAQRYEVMGNDEEVVNLEKPVPVHIEYYVVRVDDLGRVNFLADLYRLNTHRYKVAKKMDLGEAIPASVLE